MLHEAAHLAGAWRDSYIEGGDNPLYNKSGGFSNQTHIHVLSMQMFVAFKEDILPNIIG